MRQNTRETYLETQIRTATPQKCRLLLIEGAIRFARQALECWDEHRSSPQWYSTLDRCNDILTELSTSIQVESVPFAAKVKAIYQFLLMQLAQVTAQKDPDILRDVIEVLESERATWQHVCEQLPEAPARPEGVPGHGAEVTTTGMSAILPHMPATSSGIGGKSDGISLEA